MDLFKQTKTVPTVFYCLLGLTLFEWGCTQAYAPKQVGAGKIKHFKHANAEFDLYTAHPNKQQQKWMQQHYQVMLTYTPYFDKRLSWYPNAWFYIDSYAIYVDSDLAKQHPEWILRDAKNNPLYIPWECHGKCAQYAGDFSNLEFRKHKTDEISAALAIGYRGVWLDDVNLTWRVGDNQGNPVIPIDPRTGKAMLLENWQRYFAEFMETVRKAFPTVIIAHNAIWSAAPMAPENPFVTRQINAADYINIERGGNDNGLTAGTGSWGYETFLHYLDYVHKQGTGIILMDYGSELNERKYGLATGLLASNGNDYFSTNQLNWSTEEHWWPGYDVDLGTALGGYYNWEGLLRRDFECGQVLLNQAGAPERSVTIEGVFHTIEGQAVTALKLAGKTAEILLKPCAGKS